MPSCGRTLSAPASALANLAAMDSRGCGAVYATIISTLIIGSESPIYRLAIVFDETGGKVFLSLNVLADADCAKKPSIPNVRTVALSLAAIFDGDAIVLLHPAQTRRLSTKTTLHTMNSFTLS